MSGSGFSGSGSGGGSASTTAKNITAHAGGGQGSAFQLVANINEVTIAASAGDSVKMPQALATSALKSVTVYNDSSNSIDVFPFLGDNFIGLADNVAIPLAAGNKLIVFCFNDSVWSY